jgi:hypothetical protein
MVNPAITAALIAASQEGAEKIEGRLKKAGATSSANATTLELTDKDRKLLDHAIAGGRVKRTADGRLYLDERAIADATEGQGFMAVLILLAVASVIASVAVLAA